MNAMIRFSREELFLFFLLFVCSGHATGQHVAVSTKLDTGMILIGDHLGLNVYVEQPEGIRVEFPRLGDTLVRNIEILDRTPVDTSVKTGNILALEQHFTLTSFDSGFYRIPPLEFVVRGGNFRDTLAANPMYLQVFSVRLDSTNRIFDIKDPYQAPLTFIEILPYLLYGLAAVVMAFLVFLYFRSRKKKAPLVRMSKPAEPADKVALRELDRLAEEKLWQKGKIKAYYTRLTGIIRRYLELRFGIPAMERTSYEIMNGFERVGDYEDSVCSLLEELLALGDLVKFAREDPLPEENIRKMDNARKFVLSTKMKPVENNGHVREKMMAEHE